MEGNSGMPISQAEEDERRHVLMILNAFASYKNHSIQRVRRTEKYVNSLPAHHRKCLIKYMMCLDRIKWCIEQNDLVIQRIIEDAGEIFGNVPSWKAEPSNCDTNDIIPIENDDELQNNQIGTTPTIEDIEKVHSILKLLVRDWSSVGAVERNKCYQPIIKEIIKHFPDPTYVIPITPSNVRILVPGAGLGRLAFEIALKGYACQGNEFSMFMLFSSNFVLNKCHKINGMTVYPWVHQFVNNLQCGDQVKEAQFPDVDPSELSGADFSMIAGDFLKVYQDSDEWNCVATCFFIDCASNVIEFIETIYKILKPGGVWVNLGPLLYHYSDMMNHNSIEPSFDILCEIITNLGFKFEMLEKGIKTKYSQNPSSMLQYEYDSVFFVCKKPEA